MAYIGQGLPADVFAGFTIDKFTGTGVASQTLTLTKAPLGETALLVTIDGVVQEPTDDFTVSGTTVTIVGTAPLNSEINVTHLSGTVPNTLASAVDVNGLSDGIILDADADTTISADTDDQIDIKVGGTDVVKITAATLDVTGPGNTGGIININNTDTEGANTDNIGRINFVGNDGSSSASGTRAAIETEVTSNFGSTQLNVEVAASGAAAARIATLSPDGLSLADGNITFEGSGHGIHLGVTSANAANLLDDYEEGTFTMGMADSSGNALTMNGTYAVMHYTKIGNMVHINGLPVVSSIASAGSDVRITGLPFTSKSHTTNYSTLAVGYAGSLSIPDDTVISAYVNSNSTIAPMRIWTNTSGTDQLSASQLSDGAEFVISGTYLAA